MDRANGSLLQALRYTAAMKFELAAIDASQSRNPQAGAEAPPAHASRPAPFAASLELSQWTVSEFHVPIELHDATEASNQIHS